MQTTVYAGGRSWIVDENMLVNWLSQNAIRPDEPKKVVREVVNDNNNLTLLNEQTRRVVV